MPTQAQAFKEELEQLVFFTLKLVLHWLALVVILVFVLVGFWLHHLFRRAYVIIEQQQTVEAQDGKKFTRKTVTPDPNQGRTRKNRARRSARKR